jgi:photosystem II stability/assembly factor-like uncharacterized protein
MNLALLSCSAPRLRFALHGFLLSPHPIRSLLLGVMSVLGLGCAAAAASAAGWTNVTGHVGGEKWGYAGVTTLAVVPGADQVLAGVSEAGLWSSTDGGATWKKLAADDKVQIRCRPHQVLFDPKDPRTFWVSGNYGDGLFKTTNGGATFARLGTLVHVDGVGVDFSDPGRNTMLVGLHEQARSLQRSTDGGRTWEKIGERLPEKSNFSTDPIVLDTKTFVCNTAGWMRDQTWGISRSEDAGTTWTQVDKSGPSGRSLVAADGAIYWGLCWGSGIIKSTDKGRTWAKLPGPARSCPVELTGGRIAALAENQVHVSEDGGSSWKKLGPVLPVKASGFVFSQKRNALFAWRLTDKKSAEAVFRLDLGE